MSNEWIKPVLAVIGMIGLTVGFFMRLISAEAYIGIVAVTITYWFNDLNNQSRLSLLSKLDKLNKPEK